MCHSPWVGGRPFDRFVLRIVIICISTGSSRPPAHPEQDQPATRSPAFQACTAGPLPSGVFLMSRRRTRVARPAQAPPRSLPPVLPLGALAAGMGLSLLAAPVMAQTAPAGEATTASQTLPAV